MVQPKLVQPAPWVRADSPRLLLMLVLVVVVLLLLRMVLMVLVLVTPKR